MTSSNRSGLAMSRSSSTSSNHSNTSRSSAISSDQSFTPNRNNNNINNNTSNSNINNHHQHHQNHNQFSSNNVNHNNNNPSSPTHSRSHSQRQSIASPQSQSQTQTQSPSPIRGIPIQPQLLHGVQYYIHPSMPTHPFIVLPPNMVNPNSINSNTNKNVNGTMTNLLSPPNIISSPNKQNIIKTPPRNNNTNTNTNINNNNQNHTPSQSPNQNNNNNNIVNNQSQLHRILEKKRNNINLSNEENAVLQKAIQTAQQQFLLWYQQQALRQRVALNSAIANGILRLNANNNNNTQQLTLQQLQALQQLQLQQLQRNSNNGQLPQTLNPSQIIAIQNQNVLAAHQLQLQAHQQQLLQAQAQQRQQQLLKAQQQVQAQAANNNNNNPWITTNHNAVSAINDGYAQNNIPNPYINSMAAYTPPRGSSNGNGVEYDYNGNMGYSHPAPHSLNMYHPNNSNDIVIDTTDWKTYFSLPVPDEFDKYFDDDTMESGDNGDDLVPLIGIGADHDVYECKEDLNFNIELEGLGIFEYGEYAKHTLCENKSVLSHTLSSKLDDDKSLRQNLYQTLGVKDVSSLHCQWLVKDLIQSQTKLRSDSQLIKDKCNVFMRIDQTSTDRISKQENIKKELIDTIINHIIINPIVPHILLNHHIHHQCCSKNDIIEISNVDMSCVNIQLVEQIEKKKNKQSADWREIVFPSILDEEEEKKKRITVGFVELCSTMANSYDPTEDVETITPENGNYALFHLVASKLRKDCNHYGEIPTVQDETEEINQMVANQRNQPIDRQLFGSKINHNRNNNGNTSNINKSQRNHRKSSIKTPSNQAQNNVTTTPSPWQKYATNATPNMNSASVMPTGYNPIQFMNPIIINTNPQQKIPNNTNYIIPQPMIYSNNNNNNNNNNNLNRFMPQQQIQQHTIIPSMNNNNNGINNNGPPQNIQNMQRQSMQRPPFQQKMPNPTSWNVGGI